MLFDTSPRFNHNHDFFLVWNTFWFRKLRDLPSSDDFKRHRSSRNYSIIDSPVTNVPVHILPNPPRCMSEPANVEFKSVIWKMQESNGSKLARWYILSLIVFDYILFALNWVKLIQLLHERAEILPNWGFRLLFLSWHFLFMVCDIHRNWLVQTG